MGLIAKIERHLRSRANALKWRMQAGGLPRSPDGRLMLHLGCGEVNAPGYVNVDARPLPHVHFVLKDLRDLSWVPQRAVDMVYMCHVLEHVAHTEVASVVRGMCDTLKPGGVLRLSVPDFDLIYDIYQRNQRNAQAILGPLMGGQDYPQNFHFGIFNEAWLTHLMARAGLSQIRRWQPDEVDHHDFVDWSGRQFEFNGQAYPISLNLQGVKAA